MGYRGGGGWPDGGRQCGEAAGVPMVDGRPG
jgi:hypothetical protein